MNDSQASSAGGIEFEELVQTALPERDPKTSCCILLIVYVLG